jgi:endonuclease/exonuclease/phosphatase family metal-dependent hydrolase
MRNLLNYLNAILFLVLIGNSCKPEKDAIKVMTLNIRYDNPGDTINAWAVRSSQICNFILAEKPDIIGMQEVLRSQSAVLDSTLTAYSSIGVGSADGVKEGEMNPVFYRKDKYDIVRNLTFWLSDTPEVPGSLGWDASLPRIVTWMELVDKISHDHFFFFNTHFANDSDSARIMSSKMLLSTVEKIAEGYPFIITGDFNMSPTSAGYKILTGPAESIPLLKDSYSISEKQPSGPSFTYNGFSDKTGTDRVDYIFVRNGMIVLDHKTVVKKVKNVFISDHWPVEATIQLLKK